MTPKPIPIMADAEAVACAAPDAPPILQNWTRLADLGDDLFTAVPPERQWLLRRLDKGGKHERGVVPLGKVGIFAAAGGVGKTMASLQLALSVATGKPWLGEHGFTVPAKCQGRVLLALGEEEIDEVRRRLFHAAQAMSLTEKDQLLARERVVVLPLAGKHVALTRAPNADGVETDAAKALRDKLHHEAGDEGWRLVVLDPLARFAGPEAEKDNAAATRFIETIEQFCQVKGNPTVLVVHHSAQHARGGDPSKADPNRDASQLARGATGITDGARFVLTLENERTTINDLRLERIAILKAPKTNLSPPLDGDVLLGRNPNNMGALFALDFGDTTRVKESRDEATRDRAQNRKKNKKPSDDEPEPEVEPSTWA